MVTTSAWLCSVMCICAGGCADTVHDRDSAQLDASVPGLEFVFTTSLWGSDARPAGALLCRDDAPTECSTVDETGVASVRGLEPNARQLYRVTKEGFVPELKHFLTGDHDVRESSTRLVTRETFERWAASRGVTLDPAKGHVAYFVLAGTGADIRLSPAAGSFLHFATLNDPDPSLTEIGAGGFGIVLNVDPGMYDVPVKRDGYSCKFGRETGWPGSQPDIAGISVRAGTLSIFAFTICLPAKQ